MRHARARGSTAPLARAGRCTTARPSARASPAAREGAGGAHGRAARGTRGRTSPRSTGSRRALDAPIRAAGPRRAARTALRSRCRICELLGSLGPASHGEPRMARRCGLRLAGPLRAVRPLRARGRAVPACALVLADIPSFRESVGRGGAFVRDRDEALLPALRRGARRKRATARARGRERARYTRRGARSRARSRSIVRVWRAASDAVSSTSPTRWPPCWNHGNAHFLRGVLRELVARGHEVARVRAG